MKRLLVALFILIVTMQSSSAIYYESGSYYSQKGSRSMSCGQCYRSYYGPVVKECSYREWYSEYGTQYGYVRGPYGWQLQSRERTWWYYNEAYNTIRCSRR